MPKKTTDKKPKHWVLQAQMISVLRRLFVKSPMFQVTRKAAQQQYTAKKKDGSDSIAHRVQYKCAMCGELFKDQKVFIEVTDKKGKKKTKKYHAIAVDHVEPFVPLEGLPKLKSGATDWNVLIERMFLGIEVWSPTDTYDRIKDKARLLCWKCHETVSTEQNKQRKALKKTK